VIENKSIHASYSTKVFIHECSDTFSARSHYSTF
jgi:hypothetical protein